MVQCVYVGFLSLCTFRFRFLIVAGIFPFENDFFFSFSVRVILWICSTKKKDDENEYKQTTEKKKIATQKRRVNMKDQHSFNVCNIQSYIDTFSILVAKRVAICVYKTDLILIRNLSKSLRPFVLNSFAFCFCRFLGFELFLMLLLSVNRQLPICVCAKNVSQSSHLKKKKRMIAVKPCDIFVICGQTLALIE